MRKIVLAFCRILGSALILLAVVNIGLHAYFLSRYPSSRGAERSYERFSNAQRSAYDGMSPDDVNDLLEWTWKPGFVYEPETGFREAPRTSRFVNVSSDGVRRTKGTASDLAAIDLDKAVLLFGGSTAFGYGLSDNQTIASHLREQLSGYSFINLGRAGYYSAQENILLLRLLHSGYKIRYAAFLDGVNERCDLIIYQTEVAQLFAMAQARPFPYFWDWRNQVIYPMQWLARRVRARLSGDPISARGPAAGMSSMECRSYGKTLRLREVALQNLKARQALCTRFDIACITFVQPFPGIRAMHLDDGSLRDGPRRILRTRYEELEPIWNEIGAVDISDALGSLHRHSFVDDVHYSDEASGLIAQRMLPALRERFGWSR